MKPVHLITEIFGHLIYARRFCDGRSVSKVSGETRTYVDRFVTCKNCLKVMKSE